jgi:hypothetical protein
VTNTSTTHTHTHTHTPCSGAARAARTQPVPATLPGGHRAHMLRTQDRQDSMTAQGYQSQHHHHHHHHKQFGCAAGVPPPSDTFQSQLPKDRDGGCRTSIHAHQPVSQSKRSKELRHNTYHHIVHPWLFCVFDESAPYGSGSPIVCTHSPGGTQAVSVPGKKRPAAATLLLSTARAIIIIATACAIASHERVIADKPCVSTTTPRAAAAAAAAAAMQGEVGSSLHICRGSRSTRWCMSQARGQLPLFVTRRHTALTPPGCTHTLTCKATASCQGRGNVVWCGGNSNTSSSGGSTQGRAS